MSIEIPLTQGKVALIDAEDWSLVCPHTWHVERQRNRWYAATSVRREDGKHYILYMHRLILGLNDRRIYTDHKDGNGLNNARSNLRACTPSENQRNRGTQANSSSGFKGVTFRRQTRKWMARIQLDGKIKYLGIFTNKEEAYAAYCKAAKELHGEFANVG